MKNSIKNDRVLEQIESYSHKSGLKIFVCEKPEFSSTYAIFGTKYGSIDTKFRIGGQGEFLEVPEGIAHYLEHKLFEDENGVDAFTRFSQTGAAANAYTAFDRTCYLFSSAGKFQETFKILLDFVQNPFFSKESVEKERGIIEQEISMYNDNADWRVFFNLLVALYSEHPVRIDIAGTADSIAKIDEKLLFDCYNTFYNPGNMFVCVAGNVKAQEVFAICDEMIKDAAPVEIERYMPKEPREVYKERIVQNLPVSIPKFSIGYKEECSTPHKTVTERVATDIVLRVLFEKGSECYKELYDGGLVNDNFGAESFFGYGYSSVFVGGEGTDPDKVREIVNKHIEEKKASGLSEEEFNRARAAVYGGLVSLFNSVDKIVGSIVDSLMMSDEATSRDVFLEIETAQSITLKQVNARLKSILDKENSSISIVCSAE